MYLLSISSDFLDLNVKTGRDAPFLLLAVDSELSSSGKRLLFEVYSGLSGTHYLRGWFRVLPFLAFDRTHYEIWLAQRFCLAGLYSGPH